tara:strand:- start:7 stop:348 length:342 start_codon:yes stop_codon:yes gene_type:complete
MKKSELKNIIKNILLEQTAISKKKDDISNVHDKDFYNKFTQLFELYSEIMRTISQENPRSPFASYYESNEDQINKVGGLMGGIKDDLDNAFNETSKDEKGMDDFPKIDDYFKQ